MIVHQALYGDKSGSYALLKTSLADTELAKRICNVTDLLDRPSTGYLAQPVFRGFAVNDFYIFIKSFPDNAPQVRKGRVLSHTLIVDQSDIHTLNNLDELFSRFLSEPDKNPELSPISLEGGGSVPAQLVSSTSREAAAINGLLVHSSFNNTLVWIEEEGYFSFISQIWKQLEGNLRAKLRLGVGFNPQKTDIEKLNILYVLEEYENKWRTSGYCIIGKKDIETLESMSSFLLAGYEDKSKPLRDLLEVFEVMPTDIEDFGYLEQVIATYNNPGSADFNQLIVFCDLISKYSPNPSVAKSEKDSLLNQVISRIESASAVQILALKNAEWKGYPNGQQVIGNGVTSWVVTSLLHAEVDRSIADVLAAVFDPKNKVQWWKTAFLNGLKTVLAKWNSSYAIIVWNWFTEDHNLVTTLGNLIPFASRVETDLVDHWREPKRELAKSIQAFSQDRNWLILHGLSTLHLHNSEESIKRQLKIDTDPVYLAALNKMSELMGDREFIQIAVKIAEARLVKIAGSIIAGKPSLLDQLDVRNSVWRQIWLRAIECGNEPWIGIKNPVDVLFALFEAILDGEVVQAELLFALSNSDHNDLSSFVRRTEIWQHLSGSARSGFLKASTLGCVKLLDNKDISIDDLENEIRAQLIDPVVIMQVIGDHAISVSTKIQLFEELPGLRESDLLALLRTARFSSGESKRLGKLAFRKNWKKVAEDIAHKIATRKDLKLAVTECHSLLGFFDRLRLSFGGYLSGAISTEDWWDAFIEQCYAKYPKGPSDRGLWGRADGENYDLLATGTGREIWVDAIGRIRNGEINVDIQKLLHEMRKDYRWSTELENLEETYR